MPRGNPRRNFVLRLLPDLVAEAREAAGPRGFAAAVEEGLRLWLAREKRNRGKAHLYPPTAREIAARHKDDDTAS
jgi:hypothetical protein